MGTTISEPLLLDLVNRIQRKLGTNMPWVLFRVYESPDVHWSIIIRRDTTSITLTKEGPPQIREPLFEGPADAFAAKAFELIPLDALEELPAQMEFWL